MDKKMHHSYHIINRTDLRVFKKEAEARQKNGEPTRIHLHALSINCSGQEHIQYVETGEVIGP